MKTTLLCRVLGHDLGADTDLDHNLLSEDEVCHRRGCDYRVKHALGEFSREWHETHADFSRDVIPADDVTDPTSLMLMLTMTHGAIIASENKDGSWTVDVDGKGSWTGTNQMDALTAAWTALGADERTT